MKVLIACEMSARVRDEFRARGHDAWSCDTQGTLGDPRWHIQDDVQTVLHWGWDMMISFPPCTDLASSGARWWPEKIADGRQAAALSFVRSLMTAPIPRICIENPVGAISTQIRKPDQIIQPWQFGHGEVKTTCLWLTGLAPLTPTHVVEGREQRVWKMGQSAARQMQRSLTYPGIAAAMAEQWSS